MRTLSKSKLMAYRQCPKRLWLEIHQPALRQDSAGTQASFDVGHQVGDIARQLYDPQGKGQLIDPQADGFAAAFARTTELLSSPQPIFEAGFSAGGALALADVMLPVRKKGKLEWRMVEVKSSTSVKDYHLDDTTIQAYVARLAGVPLASIALAHIDNEWTYPGGADYQGLLTEVDLTSETREKEPEVKQWISDAQAVASRTKPPAMTTGRHCHEPYECGFLAYCQSQEPQAQFPVSWIPRVQSKSLKSLLETDGVSDMRDVPDGLLNARQQRVKSCSLTGRIYFDATGAKQDLAAHKLPAYFLDFETIQFGVPIWKGTRPYQQIPFQFSLHRLSRTGTIGHQSFLDLSGNDPSRAFAEALIGYCGERGPVFVYNAGFETARIRELAQRFPRLKRSLLAINDRVVDLLPVAQTRYYHPSQQGSWSIKKVLPAIVPDLGYDALDGVQDGGMAMNAYLEAISPSASSARKDQLRQQLINYCGLDTYALIRLWKFFCNSRVPLT